MNYTDDQIQTAIDEAIEATSKFPFMAADSAFAPNSWDSEAPERLAIARAFLAALPKPEPDPYARLKAYAEAGARIRLISTGFDEKSKWYQKPQKFAFVRPYSEYEVHPDDLHLCPEYAPKPPTPWTLPTPPTGHCWHREDWTQGMLPDGYRPLLKDEPWLHGDEILRYNDWHVAGQHEDDAIGSPTTKQKNHCRTRRPLPAQVNVEPAKDQPTQSQQVWTPKPGDVVRLKSGGPKMAVDTVAEPDEHREGQLVYGCFWIAEDGRPQAFKLPAVLLQPAD